MNAKTIPMNRKQTGFTLTELMITLLIAAILLSQAVPSFMTMLKDNHVTTQVNDFVTSLNMARSEAVKRGGRVTVCKSINNTTCTVGGGWEQGWLVFIDDNNDALLSVGEVLLRAHGPLDPGSTLRGVGNVSIYISYVGTGFSQTITGDILNGTLVMCDSRGFGSDARAIVVGTSGRVRNAPADDITITATAC